jgi:hypothetical protein
MSCQVSALVRTLAFAMLLLPVIAFGKPPLESLDRSSAMFVSDGFLTAVVPNAVLRWDLAEGTATIASVSGRTYEVIFSPVKSQNIPGMTDGRIVLFGENMAKSGACSGAVESALRALAAAEAVCASEGAGSTACNAAMDVARMTFESAFRCFMQQY